MDLYKNFKEKLLKNYHKSKNLPNFRGNFMDFLQSKGLFKKRTLFQYCVIMDFHDLRAINQHSNQEIMEMLAQKYEVKPTQIRTVLKLHLRKFD